MSVVLPATMFVPGEEMDKMDLDTLAVRIMERWSEGDHEGIAGMPSGCEWPFEARASR